MTTPKYDLNLCICSKCKKCDCNLERWLLKMQRAFDLFNINPLTGRMPPIERSPLTGEA